MRQAAPTPASASSTTAATARRPRVMSFVIVVSPCCVQAGMERTEAAVRRAATVAKNVVRCVDARAGAQAADSAASLVGSANANGQPVGAGRTCVLHRDTRIRAGAAHRSRLSSRSRSSSARQHQRGREAGEPRRAQRRRVGMRRLVGRTEIVVPAVGPLAADRAGLRLRIEQVAITGSSIGERRICPAERRRAGRAPSGRAPAARLPPASSPATNTPSAGSPIARSSAAARPEHVEQRFERIGKRCAGASG